MQNGFQNGMPSFRSDLRATVNTCDRLRAAFCFDSFFQVVTAVLRLRNGTFRVPSGLEIWNGGELALMVASEDRKTS